MVTTTVNLLHLAFVSMWMFPGSGGHLCLYEPRQRLEVTGRNDYYLDCYEYRHPPCGAAFDRATKVPTYARAGSSLSILLYTPVVHYSKPGKFLINIKSKYDDNFYELKSIPDSNDYYHRVNVTLPDEEGAYILQAVHKPYQYVDFFSCADLWITRENGPYPTPRPLRGVTSETKTLTTRMYDTQTQQRETLTGNEKDESDPSTMKVVSTTKPLVTNATKPTGQYTTPNSLILMTIGSHDLQANSETIKVLAPDTTKDTPKSTGQKSTPRSTMLMTTRSHILRANSATMKVLAPDTILTPPTTTYLPSTVSITSSYFLENEDFNNNSGAGLSVCMFRNVINIVTVSFLLSFVKTFNNSM